MKTGNQTQRMILHGGTVRPLDESSEGRILRHGETPSPFGICQIVDSPWGICHLSFADPVNGASPLEEITRDWPEARLSRDDDHVRSVADAIFSGPDSTAWKLPLVIAGTPFQISVWRALMDIPAGTTVGYGGLAASLGRPRASRATGAAVGANRIAWLIPCHRVLRGDGSIGGYRWGTERKRAMLKWEADRI